MAALEDLGFYCADNLPVQLTSQFLDLCAKATPPIAKIALALDAREGSLPRRASRHPEGAAGARLLGGADLPRGRTSPTLVNRYRETRRRVHPLSPEGVGGGGHRGRARAAGRGLEPGGPRHRHHAPERPRAAHGHLRPRGGGGAAPGGESRLLRLPPRSAARHGAAVRRALPARIPTSTSACAPSRAATTAVARYVLESARGAVFFQKFCKWLDFLLPHFEDEG